MAISEEKYDFIGTDHDLLIVINTRMVDLVNEVKLMKSTTMDEIELLKREKLSIVEHEKTQKSYNDLIKKLDSNHDKEIKVLEKNYADIHNDIEARLRRLEKWGSVAIGGILAVEFLISLLK